MAKQVKAVGKNSTRDKLQKAFKQAGSSNLEKGKRPYPMTVRDERGYIVENGIDREDAKQFRTDREGFRKKVSNMVEENEMKRLKNGKRYINYTLTRK